MEVTIISNKIKNTDWRHSIFFPQTEVIISIKHDTKLPNWMQEIKFVIVMGHSFRHLKYMQNS